LSSSCAAPVANYKRHAALRSPCQAIITLGRTRLSEHFPALNWSNIVDAIVLTTHPHDAWLSLRDFLRDEKIVAPGTHSYSVVP
jgi:hypothetical protein